MKKREKKEKVDIQSALSDDQLEMLEKRIEQLDDDRSDVEPFDKSAKAAALRYAKEHKFTAIVVIAVAFLLAFVLIFSLIYAISRGNKTNKDDFRFYVGAAKYTASYGDVVIDETVYINMNYISELCGMTVSGDDTSVKYTLSDYEYIRFDSESEYVIINGEYIELVNKILIDEDGCFVPYHFISKVITGLDFSYSADDNEIEIARIVTGIDKNNNKKYEKVGFTTDAFDESYVAYADFGFEDIKEVIEIVDPTDISEKKFLLLVNHEHSLSSDHIPKDLVTLTCATNPVHQSSYYTLRGDVAEALYAMLDAMEQSGISGVKVSSAYRSYARQEERFEEDVALYMKRGMSRSAAENAANKYLARPGQSEHQTGLCVDFVQGTTSLTEKFENTDAFAWLSENAHKFGFILRYPEDKVDITGYGYEPWHYRFVGRTAASKIHEAGICFEEYLGLI